MWVKNGSFVNDNDNDDDDDDGITVHCDLGCFVYRVNASFILVNFLSSRATSPDIHGLFLKRKQTSKAKKIIFVSEITTVEN
jgi:hypothetical protein